MFEQFVQLGSHFIDGALAINPAVYGLILGSGGVAAITWVVNKFIKVYTEITSSKVYAGIFLGISIITSFADYILTNGQFDASNYGKNAALLIGGATTIFHGIRILKAIASQVKYYAPLIGTKAQQVKAIADAEPTPIIAPAIVAEDDKDIAATPFQSDGKPTGAF